MSVSGAPSGPPLAPPTALRRFLDGDLFFSFRNNPVAIGVFAVAMVMILGAVFAPWVAPHNPYDLASLSLNDSLLPPAWQADGRTQYLLGTDDQGRDVLSTILYGSRISLLVGVASVVLAMALGVGLGLLSGYLGGRLDAFIMRVADVQLSFPAILIALLIDGVARALLPRDAHTDWMAIAVLVGAIWSGQLGPVRAHGARLDAGGKEQGVRPGRARDRRAAVEDHGAARAAECARPGAGDRNDQHRDRDHHRSDAVVSRGRRSAHLAFSRNDDQHRQQLPLLGRVVAGGAARSGAGAAVHVGQPAR